MSVQRFLVKRIQTQVKKNNKQKKAKKEEEDESDEEEEEIPKKKKFPFSLKKNEAIIRYKIQGVSNYYKIENLQKTSSKFFQ